MKNILVPVDFSENSRVAAEYALNLGEHFKSRVVFHHVLKTTRKNGEVNGLRQETREKLQEFGEALVRKLELTDVEIGTSVNLSPNIESIKELEKLVCTDIIVMGTKGASGTKEIFSGSNTVQVIDAVNLPVLVVPEEAVFKPIRNIMMCSDYDPVSTVEVFYPVKKLAKAFDAEVRIAHVKTDDKSPNEDRMMESRREGHYFGKDVKHSFKLIKRSDVVQGIEFYNNLKGDNDIVALLTRGEMPDEQLPDLCPLCNGSGLFSSRVEGLLSALLHVFHESCLVVQQLNALNAVHDVWIEACIAAVSVRFWLS
jgi:nucleotide-binding universal stress UspA family protein